MSVIITNIEEHASDAGPHRYAVAINRDLITTFVHNREDGLATCLRKAAEAVDAYSDVMRHFPGATRPSGENHD